MEGVEPGERGVRWAAAIAQPLALAALAGLALVLSLRLVPHILGDDAAITFRYVERLADGRGIGSRTLSGWRCARLAAADGCARAGSG